MKSFLAQFAQNESELCLECALTAKGYLNTLFGNINTMLG